MDREIQALQLITLGSIVLLIALCACLLGVVWFAMNLGRLLDKLDLIIDGLKRAFVPQESSSLINGASLFTSPAAKVAVTSSRYMPNQSVILTEEIHIDGGLGAVLPPGTLCELIERKNTSNGIRWSALANCSTYVPYLPEGSFRAIGSPDVRNTDFEDIDDTAQLQPLDWSSGGYPEMAPAVMPWHNYPH